MAKQKTVIIDGKEIILQRPSLAWYYKNNEECAMANGFPNQLKMFKNYLETVVVSPRYDLNDFSEKGTTKTVTITVDSDKEETHDFTLIHPGPGWYLRTTSQYMNHAGSPNAHLMRKAYIEHCVEGDWTIEKLEQFEDDFIVLEELAGEIQKFITGGKFETLRQLIGECERFLTGQK